MLFYLCLVLIYSNFSSAEILNIFEFSSNQPKTKPIIHPFSNFEELKQESIIDPLGFQISDYIYSQEQFDSNFIQNRLKNILIPIENEITTFNSKTGFITTLSYQGFFFPGTLNLDNEKIDSILCSNDKFITIITFDLELLDFLIPGARIHFGFQWEDCSGKLISRYSLIKRRVSFSNQSNVDNKTRENIVKFLIEIELEPLAFNEMFNFLEMEFTHLPVDNGEIDVKESFMFFGFNYRKESGVIDPSIVLFNDDNNRISCDNCYAYLDSGIILKVKTSYLSIKEFKIGIYGKTKGNFELKYQFNYHFGFKFEKELFEFKFPSVKFMVGYVPIYLQPAIRFSTKMAIDINTKIAISTSFNYEQYAETTINYDGEKIYNENKFEPPIWNFDPPHVEKGATKGDVEVELSIIPKLLLYVYAIAPVQLTTVPTVFFNGDVDTEKMSYKTFFSVDLNLGLDPLEIPKEIPEIGGKTYDFGGLLPWSKSFNVCPKKEMKCKYCEGVVFF